MEQLRTSYRRKFGTILKRPEPTPEFTNSGASLGEEGTYPLRLILIRTIAGYQCLVDSLPTVTAHANECECGRIERFHFSARGGWQTETGNSSSHYLYYRES